jgi:CHAD domain-containing protein
MRTCDLAAALKLEPGPSGLDPLARMVEDISAEALDCALREDASAAQAFQAIAVSCLCRFRRDAELLARTGDARTLHQARVALRQLRSAFSIFRPVAADERFEHLRGELRWLAASTTEARDLDTLLARFDRPPLPLTAARARACGRAAKALTSARADKLLRELVAWLADGVWREVRAEAALPAAEFAAAALDRLRRKLAKKGRHLRKLDDDALHEARIAAKKLRYATEFFAGLYPADKARKRARRFAKAVRALQEKLGELHDLAVAPAILKNAQVPRASWPTPPKRKRLVERAAARFEQALERKPYWR